MAACVDSDSHHDRVIATAHLSRSPIFFVYVNILEYAKQNIY